MLSALLLAGLAVAPATTRADGAGGSALERLARGLASELAAKKPEPPVAVHVEAPSPSLANAVASALAAELSRRGLPAVVLLGSEANAEGAARARDLRTLVRLSVSLEGSALQARGDALGTWVNFWSGQTPTRPAFSAALAQHVDADEEVLAWARAPNAAPGLLKLSIGVLAHLPARPAALLMADLDGDKKAEVVVLTDDELLALSPEGKTLARYDLRGFAAAKSACREPFGALALSSAPVRLTWLSARRAHGETLSYSNGAFHPVAPADAVALEGFTAHLMPGLNVLGADLVFQGKPLEAPAPLHSLSARDGLLALVLEGGALSLSRGAFAAPGLKGAGSASVLADLDGDGTPELVTTSKAFFPEPDEVKVMAARDAEAAQAKGGAVTDVAALWQGPTPRGRALVAAAGDLDGDGSDEVVLGAWLSDDTGELQVVRRVP